VPATEVLEMISVSENGPSWKSEKKPSDKIRQWMMSVLPPHMACAFDQPCCFNFQKKSARGRPRKFPCCIGFDGCCSAKIYGCPATFHVGFSQSSMRQLLISPGSSLPGQISLLIRVKGECNHEKGRQHGQLRGAARALMIAEFQEQHAAPSEFLKTQINKASGTAFHDKHAATTLSKETVCNVSRETKAKVKKDMGLSECALSNLFLVQEATCAEDLQSRVRLFDASKNLPGIVRNISISPAETGPSSSFKMSLWTKNSCVLCQELAAQMQMRRFNNSAFIVHFNDEIKTMTGSNDTSY
jgi:hypothetical protein